MARLKAKDMFQFKAFSESNYVQATVINRGQGIGRKDENDLGVIVNAFKDGYARLVKTCTYSLSQRSCL